MTDELLRPKDVAALIGIPEGTLKSWRRRGVGPRSFPIGPRAVAYRRSVVEAYIAEREAQAVAS